MKYNVAEIKKTIVAAISFALTVLATILTIGPDLIPNEALPYINIAIAVAGTYGIFQVRNVSKNPDPTISTAEVDPA